MKKVILIIMLLAFALSGVAQAENRFVSEIRNWDFTLGGCAYLVHADTFYYSTGAKRDLGEFFNWLENDKLFFELGYLNSHLLLQDAEIGEKAYGYAGLSTNANFVVQSGISGINNLLDADFQTPEIMNDIMAHIGIVAAKKLNSDFLSPTKGWDYGGNVAIVYRREI